MKKTAAPIQAHRQVSPGFSLVELLAVVAILSVILALVALPISQITRSSNLTNSADQIVAALANARQTALARNRTVEVRFYKYTEPGDPADGRFHAMQLFLIEPGTTNSTTNPLSRKTTFPTTIYLAESSGLSSLLNPPATIRRSGTELNVPVAPASLNYTAASMNFYPDGSTSLPTGNPVFLSIVPATTDDAASSPPENFATIVVQPLTGKARLHRP